MIFFITLFRYFTIVLFFTLHFFSFSQGMQTRERAHCARSVFPFIKKKKEKKSAICIIQPAFQIQGFDNILSSVTNKGKLFHGIRDIYVELYRG